METHVPICTEPKPLHHGLQTFLFTCQNIYGVNYLKGSIFFKIKTRKKWFIIPLHVIDEVMIFGSKM